MITFKIYPINRGLVFLRGNMSNESVDTVIQNIGNMDVSDLEVRDIERLKKHLDRKKQELIKTLPPSGKPFITKQQGKTGLLYLLENEVTVKQVWSWLKETYSKDDEWIKQAKKLAFFHGKELYIELLDEPMMLGMKKDKLIRQSTFTSVSSYNHLLSRVSTVKNIYTDRCNDKVNIQLLREEISSCKDEIHKLRSRVEILEVTTDYLIVDTKMEAKLLYEQGLSQKDLAAKYGVTTRTIRNWLK